ncbi:uncharacterized protein TNCV_1508681 [Trichonephila clavipes]|nr:uncharacterized protein TNCV_1508681 [Trichonephila clavipes]
MNNFTSAGIYSGIWVGRTLNPVSGKNLFNGMADRRIFMFGSRSLLLDELRQANRRSFEAWILTSRKVFIEESERKSESSYWLLKSEDNGSGKMAVHVGGVSVSGVVTDVQ